MANKPKVEASGTTEKNLAKAKKLKTEVVGVDTDLDNVVKWSKEGRKLLFDEDTDFLELPEEIVRTLSTDNRGRYDIAKRITLKEDVVGTIVDGLRGWVKDYNVIPGSASAQTAVQGQDPKKDYRWARKELLGKHLSNGYEITRDPNVTAGGRKESCSYKTIGGEQKPESILVERPKEVSLQIKSARKKQRDAYEQATMDSYVETAAQAGVNADATST